MSYKDYSLYKSHDSWHEKTGSNTHPPDIRLSQMDALPFGGEYFDGTTIEVTDSKVTGSTTENFTTTTTYSATTWCRPKDNGWISNCGGGRNYAINLNGTTMTGTQTVDDVRKFTYNAGDICHMSVAMYIGSTDTIGLTCEILVNSNLVFQIYNHSDYCRVTVRNGNGYNDIHPYKEDEGKGYSVVVKDMDISSVCNTGYNNNSITVGMVAKSSGGQGGGEIMFLDIAVQTVGENTETESSHTETHTHTTTSTTTVTFPATADGVNIHAVKSGTEHLIPLYNDSDINNNPGKDIANTFFYLGAASGGKQYKQWMAANGASHPAIDPSHLYGYGYSILGVYLKKGKDYEVVETSTYTTTVTVPGAS